MRPGEGIDAGAASRGLPTILADPAVAARPPAAEPQPSGTPDGAGAATAAADTPGASPAASVDWRHEAERRYPDGMDATDPHVSGTGRWATVSWCGPMMVVLHEAQNAAERAIRMIDGGGCGHRCWGDHELVDLAEPENVDADREYVRGPRRAAHFETCRQCRDWASGRAPAAAMRRAAARRKAAGG